MPNWNRGQMRTEFLSYGFHFLERDSPRRANDFLQRAADEVVNEELWPWRFREETKLLEDFNTELIGTGEIELVQAYGKTLQPREYGDIMDQYSNNLELEGTPRYYYFAGGNLKVYPPTGDPIFIASYTRATWIDTLGRLRAGAGSDEFTSTCPDAWNDIIVMLAVALAQEDSEDYDEEEGVRASYERRLDEMKRALLRPINDEHRKVRVVSGEDWA